MGGSSRTGTVLSERFRLGAPLPRTSAVAEVFEAQDLQDGRRVAVKIFDPSVNPEAFARYVAAARAVPRGAAEFIAASSRSDRYLYTVFKWLEGRDLRNRLGGGTRVPWDEAIRIIVACAARLREAGTPHLDLKPTNCFLRVNHEVVLLDFGVHHLEHGPVDADSTQAVSRGWESKYRAPEQFDDPECAGAHTDVYALGVMLYEMIAGRPPFVGSAGELYNHHHRRDPPPFREVTPEVDCPQGLWTEVARALAKVPGKRHPDARQFAIALDEVLNEGATRINERPVTSRPVSPTPDRDGAPKRGAGGRAENGAVSSNVLHAPNFVVAPTSESPMPPFVDSRREPGSHENLGNGPPLIIAAATGGSPPGADVTQVDRRPIIAPRTQVPVNNRPTGPDVTQADRRPVIASQTPAPVDNPPTGSDVTQADRRPGTASRSGALADDHPQGRDVTQADRRSTPLPDITQADQRPGSPVDSRGHGGTESGQQPSVKPRSSPGKQSRGAKTPTEGVMGGTGQPLALPTDKDLTIANPGPRPVIPDGPLRSITRLAWNYRYDIVIAVGASALLIAVIKRWISDPAAE